MTKKEITKDIIILLVMAFMMFMVWFSQQIAIV